MDKLEHLREYLRSSGAHHFFMSGAEVAVGDVDIDGVDVSLEEELALA